MFNRSDTLRDQAYEQIRSMILRQELPFGSRISLADLSRNFEVSNSPLREAISLLEVDGLVYKVPGVGFHVIDFNDTVFLETSETMEIIQLGCYQQCLSKGKVQDLIELLTERLDAQKKLFNGEITFEYAYAAIAFDKAFVDVIGNDMLTKMFNSKFNLLLMITLYAYQTSTLYVDSSIQEHQAMLDAIIEGDPEKVKQQIEHHYDKNDVISEATLKILNNE